METAFTTLIETHELALLLGRGGVVVLDCRHTLTEPALGEKLYRESHIPGAYFLHLDRDLSGAMTGKNGRHPLPSPLEFAAQLEHLGIGPEVQVVAYDQGNCVVSGRAWWNLKWVGHEAVAVLNGGFARWMEEGRPVTADLPPQPAARTLAPRISMPAVDLTYVEDHLHDPGMTIIDARAEDRFRGEIEPMDRVAGHIPGALNRPYSKNLGSDGRFKPPEELRAEFLHLLGSRNPATVVHQCGSGVSACHNILAMQLAGLDTALTLYPWLMERMVQRSNPPGRNRSNSRGGRSQGWSFRVRHFGNAVSGTRLP